MGESARDRPDLKGLSEAIEYHPETDSYRGRFDSSAESVTTAVVSMVAKVAENDPLEMEPLYSAVDPDALNDLITSVPSDPSHPDLEVTFAFDDYDVTVHSYGVIAVQSREGRQS